MPSSATLPKSPLPTLPKPRLKTQKPLRHIGIDPGNDGGIAFLENDRIIQCISMPWFEEKVSKSPKGKLRKEPDFDELIEIFGKIKAFNPSIVTLEQVWAMAHDTPVTAFALGGSYKLLRGLLHTHDLPYQLIAPGSWKRAKEYNDKERLWGAGDDAKRVAIDLVAAFYPSDFDKIRPHRKGSTTRLNGPHHGRADAVLVSRFGLKTWLENDRVCLNLG